LANNEDEENDGGGILPLQLEEGEMPFYQVICPIINLIPFY
jgi:hypothetical protein